MSQNAMDLFMNVNSEGGDHNILDIFFPAPKYFVRTAGEDVKVALRLQTEAGSEDGRQNACKFQYIPILQTAVGKEQAASFE